MTSRFLIAALAATGLFASLPAHAVTPAPLFSDGAILQQGMPVPIWGTAKAGEKVTVRFAGQEQSTEADADGKWLVRLAPLKASSVVQPLFIIGDEIVEVPNVLVGEVWVCSGQSNMAWALKHSDGGEAAAQVPDPLLRVVATGSLGRAGVRARWVEATPETSPNFSGVAFFFGRALRRELNVPVALLTAAVGGTPAEMWMPHEAIKASGATRVIVGKTSVQIGTPEQLTAQTGSLYRSGIVPCQPFAIRGAIWYQGETNQNVGYDYRKTFPALIKSWRQAWGQGDFPFLFVQLASFENAGNRYFVDVRDSQSETLKTVANTAMVVSFDKSNANNVHPPFKEPIGERLALAARAVAYGEKLVYSGPVFKSVAFKDFTATITFDSIGQGLEARNGDLTGFELAGEDGAFVPATAKIVGDTVEVSSLGVTAPKWVRYAWSNTPTGNLFNRDGLPASPFRTDTLPLATQLAQ